MSKKAIHVKLDFATLVFLMHKKTMHVATGDGDTPSVEITLEKGEHAEDLQDAIYKLESEWEDDYTGEEG